MKKLAETLIFVMGCFWGFQNHLCFGNQLEQKQEATQQPLKAIDAALVPILLVTTQDRKASKIRFEVVNQSNKTIKYLGLFDSGEIAHFGFSLYDQKGTAFYPYVTDIKGPPMLSKEYIKELPVSRTVFSTWDMSYYKALPAGLYKAYTECRHADSDPEFDLTPFECNRSVYLEVTKQDEQADAVEKASIPMKVPFPASEKEILSPIVDILPVLPLDASTSMEVQFMLENRGSESLSYLSQEGRADANLTFDLYFDGQEGQKLKRKALQTPALNLSNVKRLKSQQAIRTTFSLRQAYGSLSTGRYKLVVRYQEASNKLSLTPLSIERSIFVEIKPPLEKETKDAKTP